jgi:hypothetical protein
MIDAGFRHYPSDLFPAFWEKMDSLASEGRLKAPPELIEELGQRDEEWRQWVYEREEQIIVPPDAAYVAAIRKVVTTYVAMGVDPAKLTGDPFFIALSLTGGMTLLTSEKPGKGAVKIPKVSEALGVKTITLLAFMRAEGWRF